MGFAMFSKGHTLDTLVSTEVESWDSLKFFTDILKLCLSNPDVLGCATSWWGSARCTPRRARAQKGGRTRDVTQWGVLLYEMPQTFGYSLFDGCRHSALDVQGGHEVHFKWAHSGHQRKEEDLNELPAILQVDRAQVRCKPQALKGDPVNPNSINDVETIAKLRNVLKTRKCFWYEILDREKELEKEEYERLVEGGSSDAGLLKCQQVRKKLEALVHARASKVSSKLLPLICHSGPPSVCSGDSNWERMMDPDAEEDKDDEE
ncbi:hypothetical protein B0H17DRAFT_1136543 [Mycena rosella]|uniref:Uncharacterized protein n=1 Tax=Mycena rosella TaxID=1033263 RepID=A0AAD7DAJ1_MYCRO|nr:hypothetical protein B0H17DRAFT_1136543 [Mycena rosella]